MSSRYIPPTPVGIRATWLDRLYRFRSGSATNEKAEGLCSSNQRYDAAIAAFTR
jgi:hypothetical protein